MTRWHRVAAMVAVVVSAACSGSSATVARPPLASRVAAMRHRGAQGLRAAATAYAESYLAANVQELLAVLDHGCNPKAWKPPVLRQATAALSRELRDFRRNFKRYVGRDPATIRVTSIAVRHFTRTKGEAEAHYGLPVAIEGNYNWNAYAYSGGRWHIDGCQTYAPIGGRESSSSSSGTAP